MTTTPQQEAERLICDALSSQTRYTMRPTIAELDKLADARTALLTFIAGLVEDAERINWLETECDGEIHFNHSSNSKAEGNRIQLNVPFSGQNVPALRAAIDAARKEKT